MGLQQVKSQSVKTEANLLPMQDTDSDGGRRVRTQQVGRANQLDQLHEGAVCVVRGRLLNQGSEAEQGMVDLKVLESDAAALDVSHQAQQPLLCRSQVCACTSHRDISTQYSPPHPLHVCMTRCLKLVQNEPQEANGCCSPGLPLWLSCSNA